MNETFKAEPQARLEFRARPRKTLSTDQPKLLWHWPYAVGRCSRLRGGKLFEKKAGRNRVETRGMESDVAISKRGRGECVLRYQ